MRCAVDSQGWVRCPVCGGKTRTKVLLGTRLVRFPLYCPKCHRQTVVDYPGSENGDGEEQDAAGVSPADAHTNT